MQHKYQISIDGTVAAYRFPYLLAGDSLVLKQDSPYYEHFYKQLEPYEHYIPFKRDLSDLLEVIQWAKENDEKVGIFYDQLDLKYTPTKQKILSVFYYHVHQLTYIKTHLRIICKIEAVFQLF